MQKGTRSTIQLSEFSRGVLRDRPIDRLPSNALADSYGFEVAPDGGMWTEPRYEDMTIDNLPNEYWVAGCHAFPLSVNAGGLYYLALYNEIDFAPGTPHNQIYTNYRDQLGQNWESHQDFIADEDGFGTTYFRPCAFADLNAKVFAGWFGYGMFGDPGGAVGPPEYGVTAFDAAPLLHTPSGSNLMTAIQDVEQHHQRLYAACLSGDDVTILFRSDPGDGDTWQDIEFDSPKNYKGSNINAIYSEEASLGIIYGNNLMAGYGETFQNRRYVTLTKRFGTVHPNTVVLRPDGRGAFCLGHDNEVYYIPQGVQVPIRISGEINRYRFVGDTIYGASADTLGDYYRISPSIPSPDDFSLHGYAGAQQEGNTGWTYNWRLGAWTRSAQYKEWTPDYICPQGGMWSWVQSCYDESLRRNVRFYSRLDVTDTSVIHYLDVNRELANRHIRSTDGAEIYFETGMLDFGEAVSVKDILNLDIWVEPIYPERTPISYYRVAVKINDDVAWTYLDYNDRSLSARTAAVTPLFPLDGMPHRARVDADFTIRKMQVRVELRSDDIASSYTDPDFGVYLAQGLYFRDLVIDFRGESREF